MLAGFELTRNITIGQYLPTGSLVHRMDPRVKLLAFTILVIAMAVCDTYGGNIIALAFACWLFYMSRIPINYGLSGVKPAIPFILILAVLQLLFYTKVASGGTVLVDYGFILITSDSIRLVVVSAFRFIEIIFLSSVLTLSTSTTQITHGIESLLRPLKRVKFPVHEFALIITIAIRFVPTFAMEMEKMMKAQASRGAEFGTGAWWRIIQRTKDVFPIIIPLFNVAMSRAEDLVLAMEARCYTPGSERSIYTKYKAQTKDYIAILFCILFAAFLLAFPFPY
ncbi:energy-coupling factor transporter transmembrane component T family protein [Fictibacillus sp. KU28468]|uniref:energy-coupling factor transporter transmembrane component T family protein n=1 Tax=Fictibacillus sp. KU28468 TaxID=2991053 RepID=UPI00223DEFAB|nr:energy-coupling factor transporter transmembrane component T [Fictibacillus sp. KU28468]UZJ80964.1 energy-coupling factor transporter transmembrane protein EcfT [Fictibacillus sp. KU28468]